MNNLEITSEGGLKCDNPKCDWRDDTVTFENLEPWINKPCPLCGENVLTEVDFLNAKVLRHAFDLVNSLPPDVLEKFNKEMMENEEIRNHPMMKDIIGLDDGDGSGFEFKVGMHKELKISDIKKIKKDE